MIASTHLAVGAATGLVVQKCLSSEASELEKLFWAFTAGFVSHLILDVLPHQEYYFRGAKLGLILFVETMAMFVLLLSSPSNSLLTNIIIFFGMAGGALPDVIGLVHVYVFNWPWLGNLGSKVHFYHGAIPTGFMISFYFQSLITFFAVVLVKLRPVL